jgi:hypothetical protein
MMMLIVALLIKHRVDVGFDVNVSQERAATVFTVEELIGWLHCSRHPQLTSADLYIQPELDA